MAAGDTPLAVAVGCLFGANTGTRTTPSEEGLMTAVAVYTLDEFVKDLQQAFASHPDLTGRANAVTEVLEHLLDVGGWVQEMIDKGGYESLPGGVYTDPTY